MDREVSGAVGEMRDTTGRDKMASVDEVRSGEGEASRGTDADRKPTVIWRNAAILLALHIVALYAVLSVPLRECLCTCLWGVFLCVVGMFGVTAGTHRLWCHRSYKAKLPLRIILAICYDVAGQYPIHFWVRDHRVHHKFTETDADPYNAKRGFLFSHYGWIVSRRHPELVRRCRQIDMSDVLEDPVVAFNDKYFTILKVVLCFVLPVVIPCYLWNETLYNSSMINILRYMVTANSTFSVNSFAHMYGNKPFDRRIYARENPAVALFTMGEGWHNYHHVFPWDYRAAELGSFVFNLSTLFLDLFARIGWAYDMRTPSRELVNRVAQRHGDGSHSGTDEHVREVLEEEEDPHLQVAYPLVD